MNQLTRYVTSLCLVLTLAACGDDGPAKVDASQVVAKVNGEEISIHQVNAKLSQLGGMSEAESKAQAKKILQQLVAEQILLQKAKEAKLDRNPKVLQAMEAAKRQVLARAYIEKNMIKEIKPSQDQIDGFYNSHPELFAERRAFRLQELVIKADATQREAVQSIINGQNDVSAIGRGLQEAGYTVTANASTKVAEQLPSALLKQLQPLQDGELTVIENGGNINVVKIAQSQTKSISPEDAKPVIEKYFVNKNKVESMQSQMQLLKDSANVEYVGAFADMQEATDAVMPSDSELKLSDEMSAE